MKKRFGVGLISLLALATLVGCNGGNSSTAPNTSNTSNTPNSSYSSNTADVSGNTSSSSVLNGLTSFSISNKDALQADFYLDETNRKMEFTSNLTLNYQSLIASKDLVITSSDPTIAAVNGLYISPVKAGKVTITAKLGSLSDTVSFEVKAVRTAKELYGTVHAGTEEDPLDNEDAVKVAKATGETATNLSYYIRGTVKAFHGADTPGNSYGNVSFTLTPATEDGTSFTVFRVFKGADKKHVTEDDIWVGGTATVYAQIYNYNGKTPETSAGYLVSCTGEKPAPQKTIESTVAAAITAAGASGDNVATYDKYAVTGYVVLRASANEIYISDTKGEVTSADVDTTLELYNYSGDKNAQLTIDAKVKVTGTVTKYVSTSKGTYKYEFASIDTVEILEAGQEPDLTVTDGTYVTAAPTVETEYYAGSLQGSLNKMIFADGKVTSNRLNTTDYCSATKVKLAPRSDNTGLDFKIGDQYVVLNSSNKVELAASASTVWTFDTVTNSLKTTSGSTTYYLATYGSYSTFSATAESHVVSNGALKSGEYVLRFYDGSVAAADPTGFQIEKEASVIRGKTTTISVLRANPYNADLSKIVWASDNEAVATVVAGGVVTGVAAGTATISATFTPATGTPIVKKCMVTVNNINLGTKDAPLTLAQAKDIYSTIVSGTASGTFSEDVVYVTGKIKAAPVYSKKYSSYNFTLTDGTEDLIVYSSVLDTAVTKIAQNDTVTVAGHVEYYKGKNDKTGIYEIAFSSKLTDDYKSPKVLARTAGTSTISLTATNATVTGIADQDTATNDTEKIFTVSVATGYVVDTVTVNGKALTAESDGSYKFTVEGDMKVVVTARTSGGTVSITATNATVTGVTDGTHYDEGSIQTFTVSVADGYQLVSVTINGEAATADDSGNYSFTVHGDVAIVVTTKTAGTTTNYSEVAKYDFSGKGSTSELKAATLKSLFVSAASSTSPDTDIVTAVSSVTNVWGSYNAETANLGLKFGTSSKQGIVKFTTSTAVSRAVVSVYGWNGRETVSVGKATAQTTGVAYNAENATASTLTFDFTATSDIDITFTNRGFLQSIVFYTAA